MHNATPFSSYSLLPSREITGISFARKATMYVAHHPHPFLNAVTSVTVIGTFLLATAAAATVKIIATPSSPDAYALVGALAAEVMVLVAVRQFQKGFWNFVSVFTCTLLVGFTAPGAIVRHYGWEDSFTVWNYWVLAGWVCGLGGWTLGSALYHSFTKGVPSLVDLIFAKFRSRIE